MAGEKARRVLDREAAIFGIETNIWLRVWPSPRKAIDPVLNAKQDGREEILNIIDARDEALKENKLLQYHIEKVREQRDQSQEDLAVTQLERAQFRSQRNQLQGELVTTQLERDRLQVEVGGYQQAENQRSNELQTIENRVTALEGDLLTAEGNMQTVLERVRRACLSALSHWSRSAGVINQLYRTADENMRIVINLCDRVRDALFERLSYVTTPQERDSLIRKIRQIDSKKSNCERELSAIQKNTTDAIDLETGPIKEAFAALRENCKVFSIFARAYKDRTHPISDSYAINRALSFLSPFYAADRFLPWVPYQASIFSWISEDTTLLKNAQNNVNLAPFIRAFYDTRYHAHWTCLNWGIPKEREEALHNAKVQAQKVRDLSCNFDNTIWAPDVAQAVLDANEAVEFAKTINRRGWWDNGDDVTATDEEAGLIRGDSTSH